MTNPPPYRVSGDLPLTFEPQSDTEADRNFDALCTWLRDNQTWVHGQLVEHGALRFRGFGIDTPQRFEALARSIDDDLKNNYLGTSPRDGLTDYVFSASELPDYFPIPQHCEMSFCGTPPRRLFFQCLEAPAPGSGETPLCDFRKVWRDLPDELCKRFEEKGIRIVRNYSGPSENERSDDPTMLKSWDEMFLTRDREEVERQCRDEGFETEWLADDGLRLISTQLAFKDHPVDGTRSWFNHITTFHSSTALAELSRIAAYRPSERHQGLVKIATSLHEKLEATPPEERSMHCTHLDGSEISLADLDLVRDMVWQHLVVEPWENGDVVAIDNYSVSHGRLPYEGPRQVAVCWA